MNDRSRFADPLLGLGIMLMVIPFAVLAVPAEWSRRSQSARGWQPSVDSINRTPVQTPPVSPQHVSPQPVHQTSPQSEPRQTPVLATVKPIPAVSATPQQLYTTWLNAHPVIKDADLTDAGSLDGQAPQRPIVGFRIQAIADLTLVGTPNVITPLRPPVIGNRMNNTVEIILTKPSAVNNNEVTAAVDLTKLGTAVGATPTQPSPIGERNERLVDLSRKGTPPGVPPHIPTREDR